MFIGDLAIGTVRIQKTEWYVEACLILPTRNEAIELASRFPKSAKVRGTAIGGMRDENGNRCERGWVGFIAKLATDGVNGGTNETGLRRFASFEKTVAALGLPVEYVSGTTVLESE